MRPEDIQRLQIPHTSYGLELITEQPSLNNYDFDVFFSLLNLFFKSFILKNKIFYIFSHNLKITRRGILTLMKLTVV